VLKYSQASCLYLPALRHLTLTTKSEEAIIVEQAAVRVKTERGLNPFVINILTS